MILPAPPPYQKLRRSSPPSAHSHDATADLLCFLVADVKDFGYAKLACSQVQQAAPYLHPALRGSRSGQSLHLGNPVQIGEVQCAQVVGTLVGYAEPEVGKLRDMLSPAVQGQRPATSLFPLAANRVEAVGADGVILSGGDAIVEPSPRSVYDWMNVES
ncbi:hypothetical protein ZWY2020_012332 [Hordeum vulgare]|nr:hypothetical protein ZWY2020_012332 [Hordeum vulgare]